MNKTVPVSNVVRPHPVSNRGGLQILASWSDATSKQYGTKTYWLYRGLGMSKKEKPTATLTADGNTFSLFHRSQTRPLAEPCRSRRLLIARFIHQPEMVGVRSHDTGEITQWPHWELYGSLRDLVYKSFNYKHARKGVPMTVRWPHTKIRADDFYVRAGDRTNWFVLDVDNHDPTAASTQAHLRLVQRLISLMPALVKSLGGGSVFYAYRQDAPKGIHIWVILGGLPRITKNLHESVRRFLKSHSDPSLDQELDRLGLRKMHAIEILPTEGHLIRLFGSWHRRVFTTKELKPKDGWFDAKDLYDHITAKVTNGDPYQRYADLVHAGLQAEPLPDSPSSAPMDADLTNVLVAHPQPKGNYFSSLVDSALNGVREEDNLFFGYLSPLARALFYRDFYGHPNQRQLVVSTLMAWLERKHNGMVTRINKDNRRNLVAVLHHIVRHMHETPTPIQHYWDKVRENDARFPNQKILLASCMRAELPKPFPVTKATLNEANRILEEMGIGDEEMTKGYTYNSKVETTSPSPTRPLPSLVEARLRDHMGRIAGLRTETTERIIDFAENLLHEIGLKGEDRISWERINEIAGLGKSRRHADRYKKILFGAGIIRNWKNSGIPTKKATLYRLTHWVIQEMEANAY